MDDTYFTQEGIAALEKMAKEGAQKATDALSSLIHQHVDVNTVAVQSVKIDKIYDFIGGRDEPVTTIFMGLSGDVVGQMMLIYPKQAAYNVADFLSKRALGTTSDINELDKSSLKESGNIIAGAFLSAISDYLDINMIESPPELVSNALKETVDTAIKAFEGAEPTEAIAMEIQFAMATAKSTSATAVVPEIDTQGFFILLFDATSAKNIMQSLKGISGGEQMVI